MVSSQVRQAVYQHRAAKERLERVARQTEHDARDAYLGVLSEISHVKALRRALESNTTALNATESGYEAGTRTAVDVLESRRRWIQAQTDYSRSRYDYMINVLKLQQAAGILSEQSLNRLNGLLKDSPPPMRRAPPTEPGGCYALSGAEAKQRIDDRAAARRCRGAFRRTPVRRRPLAAAWRDRRKIDASTSANAGASATSTAPPRSISNARDFLAVGVIRPGDHRHAERGRLEQIVPADRHQAPADERDIGGRIERREFADGIDQQHLRRPAAPRAGAAPIEATPRGAPTSSPRFRSAADGAAPASTRACASRLYSSACAASSCSSSPAWVLPAIHTGRAPRYSRAQLRPLLEHRLAELHVEFHVADDVRAGAVGADGDEALGILRTSAPRRAFCATASRNRAPRAAITRHGFRRQARAREHHGHAAPPALVEQIRPKFGLHDYRHARPDSREESRTDPGVS